MKTHHRSPRYLIVVVVALALLSLACKPFSIAYAGWCELVRGGSVVYDSKTDSLDCIPSGDDESLENVVSQEKVPEDVAACMLGPGDYELEIIDFREGTTGDKRSCNAKGLITNTGELALMFAVYRVNHFGAEEHFGEEWLGAGYQILETGHSAEYGKFYRCTGDWCGDGEWDYIQQLSLWKYTPECNALASSLEDKPPASIIPVKNPCEW